MAEKRAKSISHAKTEVRKSRVHRYIVTDRGVYPFSLLKKHEENLAQSRQLEEDDPAWMREHGLIELPFNVGSLLWMQDNCTYFDACVRQIATDVIAGGYTLVPVEEGKDDEAERKEIEQLLNDPNNADETFLDIVHKCVIDWGVIGWWAIEVSRGTDGLVNGLFHVPAHTVRVHRSRRKYCQVRDTRKRWFIRFGENLTVNENTGAEHKTSKHRANEIIFHGQYYAQNTYYGRPNILPAVGASAGLIGIRSYNLAFFENYGIPAAFVLLEGEWEEGSAKLISDFLENEVKGSDNAHKTVVMEIAPGSTVTWKPLAVEEKEGHFVVYAKELRDEILSAYKMPPYRIGIAEVGKLGGTTAPTADRIYIQAVVEPLQRLFERLITAKILNQGLGAESYRLQFHKIDTRDWDALVQRWERLFGMGVITPGWMAEQLGLPTDEMPHAGDYFLSHRFVPVEEAGLVPAEMSDEDIRRAVEEVVAQAKKGAEK